MKQFTDTVTGFAVKGGPELKDELFLKKIAAYDPDKIFVFDKAIIAQDFIDRINHARSPIIWVDHHPLISRQHVHYFNPLMHPSKKFIPDNRPTAYWIYRAVEDKQYEWLALIGCVTDWFIPEFTKNFSKVYPALIPKKRKWNNPGDILYETPFGDLCRVFEYALKGLSGDSSKRIEALSEARIPKDILDPAAGNIRSVVHHYERIRTAYESIKSQIKITDDRLVVFRHTDDHSLTRDLATEMQYRYPDKVFIIAREKGDEMKCSLRSGTIPIRALLEASLEGVRGHGGGHEHACGAGIHKEDFEIFLQHMRDHVAEYVAHAENHIIKIC